MHVVNWSLASDITLGTGTPYIEVNLSLPDVNSPLTGASMAMLH